jgi:hypothetical protein
MVSELEKVHQSIYERFKNHVSTLATMRDLEPVDFVVNTVGDALRDAGLVGRAQGRFL